MVDAVDSAAVATLNGVNPLWFLGLNPEDYALMVNVLNRAQQMRQDYDRDLATYQARRFADTFR